MIKGGVYSVQSVEATKSNSVSFYSPVVAHELASEKA